MPPLSTTDSVPQGSTTVSNPANANPASASGRTSVADSRRDAGEEVVLDLPLYVRKRYSSSLQTHMLIRLIVRLTDDGRVYAIATCDEVRSSNVRDVASGTSFNPPNLNVYIPDDIFAEPIQVIIEKLRGIRLRKRILVEITFVEWFNGQPATFDLEVSIRFMTAPITAVSGFLDISGDIVFYMGE